MNPKLEELAKDIDSSLEEIIYVHGQPVCDHCKKRLKTAREKCMELLTKLREP